MIIVKDNEESITVTGHARDSRVCAAVSILCATVHASDHLTSMAHGSFTVRGRGPEIDVLRRGLRILASKYRDVVIAVRRK